MTQENKDLLLQDLCGRLPYGVKMQKFNEQNVFVDLYAINLKNYTIDFYTYKGKSLIIANTSKLARSGILLYKPCLFPFSSMTPKQKAELSMLVVGVEDIFKSFLIEVEFYHKHHIDYRGLIPMGLAIDATGLNIY